MGKTLQAISLIATHRTDDNSKLPRLTPAEGVQPLRQRKHDVLKLKLPGAPSRAPQSEPVRRQLQAEALLFLVCESRCRCRAACVSHCSRSSD